MQYVKSARHEDAVLPFEGVEKPTNPSVAAEETGIRSGEGHHVYSLCRQQGMKADEGSGPEYTIWYRAFA